MRTLLATIVLTIIYYFNPAYGQEDPYEIVVDNEPIITLEDGVVANFIGIRPLAGLGTKAFLLSGRSIQKDLKISKRLLVKAAFEFDEITDRAAVMGLELNNASIDDLKSIVRSSEYKKRYLYDAMMAKGTMAKLKPRIIESDIANTPEYKLWDATILMNMLVTGVINTDEIHYISKGDMNIETFGFDELYIDDIQIVYSKLPFIANQKIENTQEGFEKVGNIIRSYNSLEKSFLVNLGEITFGKPIIYTSDEVNLEIPDSLMRNYDIYYLELSATFRRLSAADLEEMAINFALPKDAFAFALAPLEYGTEIDTTKTLKTPEIGGEFKGVKISVGEIFRRTVSYTYIKPTIIGFGLGESRFSWTLTDQAIRAGSHKFAVAIGVPKGSSSVDLEMSAHVRMSKFLLAGGRIAGTEVHKLRLAF